MPSALKASEYQALLEQIDAIYTPGPERKQPRPQP